MWPRLVAAVRGDIDNGYCVAAVAEAEAGLVLYHSVSAVLSQTRHGLGHGARSHHYSV